MHAAVWHQQADTVAKEDWVSSGNDRFLVVDSAVVGQFGQMADFDRFAARLLLLAMLLKRRAVIPSMSCAARWAQAAMEPR